MELKFENRVVAKYFNDFHLIKRKIGLQSARQIKKRYDQLGAAPNFSIYLNTGFGKPHSLSGDLKGCYGISIDGNVRLVVRPGTKDLDPASLKTCDSVIIKGVVNYHGRKKEWLFP